MSQALHPRGAHAATPQPQSKHSTDASAATYAVPSSSHSNGRSAASGVQAAAQSRKHAHTGATAAADEDDRRDAGADDDDRRAAAAASDGVEYVAAEPLDDATPSSGVLTFMRRARSDPAEHAQGLFRMDSDEAPTATAAASAAPHRRRGSVEAEMHRSAASSAHPPAHPRPARRGSVEAELQLPLPDEDALVDGTVPLEIGRADSPEVEEEEKEGDHGVELESVMINRAAAAAAAEAAAGASVPHAASAYRSALAPRPSGGLSVGDFELLSVIGRGAYGKVFLVRAHASGRLYAMKVVLKSEAIRKNVVSNMVAEKNVLEAVRHPFIVNLRFAFQTESKLYLVLDYIGGGELFARLDASKDHSLSIKEARFYAAEIVLAIEHLHKNSIVYRDLKPENCMLTRDGHICLTDFGFAKEGIAAAESGTNSFCGTLHYMSPEMIQYAGHGKGSDWWALGALLHEMLTGTTPFQGNNRKVIQDNILTAPLKLPKWMDNPTKSILTELLRRPISKRLGCGPSGAAAVKSHPFFSSINWKLLEQKKVPPPFVPPMSEAGEACTRNFDVKFTAERVVDTPVSPSQMANVLAGHGISPGAFLTADATFANFAYKRDHTPGASPMLRGLDPTLIRRQASAGNAGDPHSGMDPALRRQGSAGNPNSNGGVFIGSPRPLSGLPPPHHPVHHHSSQHPHSHPHPESLELTPPAKAAPVATSTVAHAAAPAAPAEEDSLPWPAADPVAVKQREQQAAAKAAQRKAAQQQQGQPVTPASPPPSAAVPAAASASSSVASPPRVKKPKPVKAHASPPAPVSVDTAAPSSASSASASASPLSSNASASASASPSSAGSGPSGGAASQLSKQLAARHQRNNQQQQQQQQQQAAQTQQAPAASMTMRPPPGRGWEVKSGAGAASVAPAASLPSGPPPPPPAAASTAAAVAPAPLAAAPPSASAAAGAPLGIRVLGGIKSLAPVPGPAPVLASASSSAATSSASSSSSVASAPPPAAAAAPSSSVLSPPLRLSAAAKVFVPGAWGAPKPPVTTAPAAHIAPIPSVAPPAAHSAANAAPGPPVARAAAPVPAAQAAKPISSLPAGAPASASSVPVPVPAPAPVSSSTNPLGPARWGAKASAPAPIPQKRA